MCATALTPDEGQQCSVSVSDGVEMDRHIERDCTFGCLVVCALSTHIRNDDPIELSRSVFLIEYILHPFELGRVTSGAADFVACEEELICDVRADEAVHACDEDCGPVWDGGW